MARFLYLSLSLSHLFTHPFALSLSLARSLILASSFSPSLALPRFYTLSLLFCFSPYLKHSPAPVFFISFLFFHSLSFLPSRFLLSCFPFRLLRFSHGFPLPLSAIFIVCTTRRHTHLNIYIYIPLCSYHTHANKAFPFAARALGSISFLFSFFFPGLCFPFVCVHRFFHSVLLPLCFYIYIFIHV